MMAWLSWSPTTVGVASNGAMAPRSDPMVVARAGAPPPMNGMVREALARQIDAQFWVQFTRDRALFIGVLV
jgi:hypothetical protein